MSVTHRLYSSHNSKQHTQVTKCVKCPVITNYQLQKKLTHMHFICNTEELNSDMLSVYNMSRNAVDKGTKHICYGLYMDHGMAQNTLVL